MWHDIEREWGARVPVWFIVLVVALISVVVLVAALVDPIYPEDEGDE